jgi:hypothetical protein
MNSALAGERRVRRSHIWAREEYDLYVEPSWCSERLFDIEPFTGAIHDPCCGSGRIIEAAQRHGYETTCADIADRGQDGVVDFLDVRDRFTNIVSNPPFDIAPRIAAHALSHSTGKVALIFLTRRLNAAHKWLKGTPLRRVLFMTPRPSMPPYSVWQQLSSGEEPTGDTRDYCWLIWELGYGGEPTIGWLHREK